MAKTPRQEDQDSPDDEAHLMEQMNKGLRRLLNTPPETHEDMVKRRNAKSAGHEPKNKRFQVEPDRNSKRNSNDSG
jgi:hypothetical protein